MASQYPFFNLIFIWIKYKAHDHSKYEEITVLSTFVKFSFMSLRMTTLHTTLLSNSEVSDETELFNSIPVNSNLSSTGII